MYIFAPRHISSILGVMPSLIKLLRELDHQ
jgi:hypothetical protein